MPGWGKLRMPHSAVLRRMVRNLEHVYSREANLGAGARIAQYAQILDKLDKSLRA